MHDHRRPRDPRRETDSSPRWSPSTRRAIRERKAPSRKSSEVEIGGRVLAVPIQPALEAPRRPGAARDERAHRDARRRCTSIRNATRSPSAAGTGAAAYVRTRFRARTRPRRGRLRRQKKARHRRPRAGAIRTRARRVTPAPSRNAPPSLMPALGSRREPPPRPRLREYPAARASGATMSRWESTADRGRRERLGRT